MFYLLLLLIETCNGHSIVQVKFHLWRFGIEIEYQVVKGYETLVIIEYCFVTLYHLVYLLDAVCYMSQTLGGWQDYELLFVWLNDFESLFQFWRMDSLQLRMRYWERFYLSAFSTSYLSDIADFVLEQLGQGKFLLFPHMSESID